MEEVDLLQATIDVIGEADNEIGGFRQTRVASFTEAAEAAPDSFEWSGGNLVSYGRNPTEMSGLPWIRLDSDGRLFEVTAVVALGGGDYQVQVDLAGATAPVTSKSSVPGAVTFVGLQVLLVNPQYVPVGGWIRATGDDNWYEVVAKSGSVVTIVNPHGFIVPSGLNTIDYSPNPVVSVIIDQIEVESVLNWPDSGFVAIDGVLYHYTSKTLAPMVLEGITYFDANQEILGLAGDHSEGAIVTDVTREFSGLEQTRNAMLVDYANGEDLNAQGRNLGVLRYPFLESDDVFREIIKALAYNPRGTMFGLELALDAMVGRGNYELYEDLVNHPCTVFVRLLGSAATTDRSEGKTFLTGPEPVDPTTTTSLDIGGTVVNRGTVYSVRLKDHIHDGDFRAAKPSGLQIEDIPGSPVQAWTYVGTGGSTEAANVTLLPGIGVQITHAIVASWSYYTEARRFLNQTTDWSVDCVFHVPVSASLGNTTTRLRQLCVMVADGEHYVGWGCMEIPGNPAACYIRMISGSSWLPTYGGIFKGNYNTIRLTKTGGADGIVGLWINGDLVGYEKRSAFTGVTSNRTIDFGVLDSGAPTTVAGVWSQLSFNIHTKNFDFWNLYHDAATLGAPNDIQIATSEFLSGDVGKRIETTGSGATNSYGGNNNGKFEVSAFTDVNNIEVQGVTQEAAASMIGSSDPLRIVVDERKQQFVFPDDLGKEIVLLDSAQGNNGTYVIEKLFHPNGVDDLAADFDTPLRTVTNICEVEEPAPSFEFVAETGVSFRLDPVFVSEGSMSFVMSAAGSESGGTLTLREALPSADDIVDVWYNEVLSALILLDLNVKNEIVQLLPEILWQYYPFYLSDPFGFVATYLDDLTAAGVIPEYSVE